MTRAGIAAIVVAGLCQFAAGNPKANEEARKIADERARGFACCVDQRVIVVGDSVPDFSRSEN